MKPPHQMTYPEFVAWARSKIIAPDGRISRAGVAEVRRDLVSRVGYLRRTPDEKAVQEAIKLLDPEVNLTTEAVAQLETITKNAIESIAEEGAETEVATQPTNETAAPAAPGLENVHKMNAIASTAEGRIALQRARNGQDLDAQQQRLVDDYRALEKAHNDAAKPAYSGGVFSTSRPTTIPSDLFRIDKIADARERAMAIRELKSRWRDDPGSDFNNVKSPEHKNAVAAMSRLYEASAELPQPEDEK